MEAASGNSRTSETKYERLRRIGIGSYGVVFKCVNRQTGQIVAIKRYSENDSDPVIRKIAMREVRMLRQLKHPNLIQLLEVFRRKRILHLVFDYCELTVLDVIERYASNCPLNLITKIIWQLVNGVSHCHSHNCIHRDIKPENILINQAGIVKLCDFGFARNLNNALYKSAAVSRSSKPSQPREPEASRRQAAAVAVAAGQIGASSKENLLSERQALTEYVATRWYRAPELLVGDIYYDFKIDIWAIGCVAAELMRGEPLWPGKTDLEQLCLIENSLGQLTPDQKHNLLTRGLYEQAKVQRCLSQTEVLDPLERKLPSRIGQLGVEFVIICLEMDPARRPTSNELLKHDYIHSALMGQFVRGVASGHNSGGSLLQGEHHSAATSRQKPVGSGVLGGLAARPIGQARVVVHRSNSQAILRAAADQQQPPSKRIVVGPDSSADQPRADGNHPAPDSQARPSLRVASKPTGAADLTTNQPRTRQAVAGRSRGVSRSQSQATAMNELDVSNRGSSSERSSQLSQRVTGGDSPSVPHPKRTSEGSNRAQQNRTQQSSRRADNVAARKENRAPKLPAGAHSQLNRNTTADSIGASISPGPARRTR